MARKLRVQFEGAIYHVTLRGVERRRIFDDAADSRRFLERLGTAVEDGGVRLYLFCLMTNHAHLVVETPRANLSVFMHNLQTAYIVYYNRRHKRSGHLTQGRFGAQPVDGDNYLLKLSRYIHLNPVCVGSLVEQPWGRRQAVLRAYPWSSYRGYAGLAEPYAFVDEAPVLAMMETAARKQRRAYRRFVEAGLAERDEEWKGILKGSGWGIGGEEFQERIRDLHTELASRVRRPEDVSFRQVCRQASPEEVLEVVAAKFRVRPADLRRRRYDCVARAVAAELLGRHAGMNQRDIGQLLSMGTGSAVCRQLKRLRERRARDAGLSVGMGELTSDLKRGTGARVTSTISIVKG